MPKSSQRAPLEPAAPIRAAGRVVNAMRLGALAAAGAGVWMKRRAAATLKGTFS